jgi:hypothetical protein
MVACSHLDLSMRVAHASCTDVVLSCTWGRTQNVAIVAMQPIAPYIPLLLCIPLIVIPIIAIPIVAIAQGNPYPRVHIVAIPIVAIPIVAITIVAIPILHIVIPILYIARLSSCIDGAWWLLSHL